MHGDGAERRGAGEVLQRNPLGALGDQTVVALLKAGPGVGEGQPATVGAYDVGGQQFRVRAW